MTEQVLPDLIGPYRIERRLGIGGMAETFIGIRQGSGRFEQRVCVKRILPHLTEDPMFRTSFLAEARIAAMLQHSRIVSLLDFGDDGGDLYMVLELIDGADLSDVLERAQTFSVELTIYVAFELLHALDYAHRGTDERPGVLHRDLSPSNVLISRAGEVKLADFGIAKALSSGDAVTRSEMIKGKVCYMAPEQAFGQKLDARADLFALGVIFYELLAGRRPFDAATELATLHRIYDGTHDTIDTLRPDLPPLLTQTIERMITSAIDRRPGSAAEVLQWLAPLSPMASHRVRRYLGRIAGAIRDGSPDLPPLPSGMLSSASHPAIRLDSATEPILLTPALGQLAVPAQSPDRVRASMAQRAQAPGQTPAQPSPVHFPEAHGGQPRQTASQPAQDVVDPPMSAPGHHHPPFAASYAAMSSSHDSYPRAPGHQSSAGTPPSLARRALLAFALAMLAAVLVIVVFLVVRAALLTH